MFVLKVAVATATRRLREVVTRRMRENVCASRAHRARNVSTHTDDGAS